MRILGVSDIHGQAAAVRRLRSAERNSFDAVVVAGDLGDGIESARDVMRILASFDCPVLYVFGNHDDALPYDEQFSDSCHHLHANPQTIDGFTFAGFSGISGAWGRNPIASAMRVELDQKHEATLARQAALEAEMREASAALDRELAEQIEALNGRTADRRSRAYRAAQERLSSKRDRTLARICRPLERAQAGDGYKTYLDDRSSSETLILAGNREELTRSVGRADPSTAIVVTHERLANTAKDMPSVPLFLHGHRHGYANTHYRGSRFINVSALDNVATMMPEICGGANVGTMKLMRNADLGTYVVMTIDGRGRIAATSKSLWPPPVGWVPAKGFKLRLPMLPREDWLTDDADPPELSGSPSV